MTIEQFIENVIRGGWTGVNTSNGERLEGEIWDYVKGVLLTTPEQFICSILLDPLAWQSCGFGEEEMLGMIRSLWSGKSIEEYLATI